MPPNSSVARKTDETHDKTTRNNLQLNDLKKSIPEAAFKKSFVKAVGAMILDYSLWFGTVALMKLLCESSIWTTLPVWQKVVASIVFWNLSGFFMWCLFMVGHDCGHNTFSDYEIVNDAIGHLTHGSLLVPFYSWQLSHRRHHMYHNHYEKDYSYPWYTKDRMKNEDEYMARFLHANPWAIFLFPFYGWPVYFIFGMPDGNHLIPNSEGRLWKNTPTKETYKCLFSAVNVLSNLVVAYFVLGQSVSSLGFYYLAPWIIFGWWLVTVTYLQHHDPGTLVYGDNNWTFVNAAFETVDRKFGYGIDTLHHHITDGHVVHHLFFTKIPHYNLPLATKAIQNYLKENNLFHLYRCENTFDFPYRVHKYFVQYGFKSTKAEERKQD